MAKKLALLAVLGGLTLAPEAQAQEKEPVRTVSYALWEFGTMPRPAYKEVLLGVEAVRDELKVTAAQIAAMEEVQKQYREKLEKAGREVSGRAKFREAREAIEKEALSLALAKLEPRQRERLDQIQLQAQGPMAFNRSQWSLPPEDDPAKRLKLSDDQVRRIQAIAVEGAREIDTAAMLPIDVNPKDGPPTLESVRKLVQSPEFAESKRKTRRPPARPGPRSWGGSRRP